jgi:hypothetical protein
MTKSSFKQEHDFGMISFLLVCHIVWFRITEETNPNSHLFSFYREEESWSCENQGEIPRQNSGKVFFLTFSLINYCRLGLSCCCSFYMMNMRLFLLLTIDWSFNLSFCDCWARVSSYSSRKQGPSMKLGDLLEVLSFGTKWLLGYIMRKNFLNISLFILESRTRSLAFISLVERSFLNLGTI